ADPVMELHGAAITLVNDNWRDCCDDCQNLALKLGLAPVNDLESIICATLDPGPYTAIVKGKNDTSGVALVEIYDADQLAPSKLGNISTRAFCGSGNDIVIGGFILGEGNGTSNMVIRGIGPSLSNFGIPNSLADPTLELRDHNGVLIT